eukprot:15356457-Ditylum_brightwellii.AAC.1
MIAVVASSLTKSTPKTDNRHQRQARAPRGASSRMKLLLDFTSSEVTGLSVVEPPSFAVKEGTAELEMALYLEEDASEQHHKQQFSQLHDSD